MGYVYFGDVGRIFVIRKGGFLRKKLNFRGGGTFYWRSYIFEGEAFYWKSSFFSNLVLFRLLPLLRSCTLATLALLWLLPLLRSCTLVTLATLALLWLLQERKSARVALARVQEWLLQECDSCALALLQEWKSARVARLTRVQDCKSGKTARLLWN